jgi:hypothetical protein
VDVVGVGRRELRPRAMTCNQDRSSQRNRVVENGLLWSCQRSDLHRARSPGREISSLRGIAVRPTYESVDETAEICRAHLQHLHEARRASVKRGEETVRPGRRCRRRGVEPRDARSGLRGLTGRAALVVPRGTELHVIAVLANLALAFRTGAHVRPLL